MKNVIKNIKLLLAGGLVDGTQPVTGPVDWAVYNRAFGRRTAGTF
jgi:hypothetical protein